MKIKEYLKLSIALLVLLFSVPSWAAVTYTTSGKVGPYSVGGKSRMVTGLMDLSGTYATNGFSVTAASFGLSHLEMVMLNPTDGYGAAWNSSTNLVKVFSSGNTEYTNAASLADVNINFIVVGW